MPKSFSDKDIGVIGINAGNVFFEEGRWEQIIKEQGHEKDKSEVLNNVSMGRLGLAKEVAMGLFNGLVPVRNCIYDEGQI